MDYGICDQTLVPVRIQPGDKHEMINQLLFGDVLTIKDNHKNWVLIETADDQYDGWIDEKQLSIIEKSDYNDLLTTNRYYSSELSSVAFSNDKISRIILTMGSSLPGFSDGLFHINGTEYRFSGKVHHSTTKPDREGLATIAKQYLDAPYLWGGRSPFGIDCSGFIQMVFRICGRFLPRDSAQQVLQGTTVNFMHEAKTGDIAFFGEEEGNIVHVGIILDNNHIIHASGKVRIDKIDHMGIFNTDKQQYTHKLRVIKSFF